MKTINAATTNAAAGASPDEVRDKRRGGRRSEPRAQASGFTRNTCETSERPAPANLTLRPAGPTDVVPLGFFFDTVLRRDYFMRRGQLEELIAGPHHQVLVAELDDVLVGVAVTTSASRLVNALVHPAYRGLGIGGALVRRSGVAEVRAKLDMSTGDPRAFYRRLGFVSTNRRNDKGNIEIFRRQSEPRAQASVPAASPKVAAGASPAEVRDKRNTRKR